MICSNLKKLMKEKDINISELSRATCISRTTLTALYYNTCKAIQFETLNKLCEFFKEPVLMYKKVNKED